MKNSEGNHKAVEWVLEVTTWGLFWANKETYNTSKIRCAPSGSIQIATCQ